MRRVPIPQELLNEIRGRVGRIVPYSLQGFTDAIRRETPLKKFHAHQLRHSFACLWLENGGSLPALQQLLGHASIVTTQRYGRLTDDAVFEEAKRVQMVPKTVQPEEHLKEG